MSTITKYHRLSVLNNQNLFPTIQEAGSPRSRHQHSQDLVQPAILAGDSCPWEYSLRPSQAWWRGRERERERESEGETEMKRERGRKREKEIKRETERGGERSGSNISLVIRLPIY
jgi:hypothetical protein